MRGYTFHEGEVLADRSIQVPVAGAYPIPFTRIARLRFKREMAANIIALGAISQLTSIVSERAIEAAVKRRVPAGTEKLNLEALHAGMLAAREVKDAGFPQRTYKEWENEDL